MKNNPKAYIALKSREPLNETRFPAICHIDRISVVNNETVNALGWLSSTGHANIDEEGYYNFFWKLDELCVGSPLDDNAYKLHDWSAIVKMPLNEFNYQLAWGDNGQKMKMDLVSFWIIAEDGHGNETPYHFNKEIIDRYNATEMDKGFSHDIVEEFAQLAHLDCANCYSRNIETTGAYKIDGTGFFADVRCKECGKLTESGDGDFLTEVAGFENGQFLPLDPLYRYSVRHTNTYVPGKSYFLGNIFAQSDLEAANRAKKKHDIPDKACQEYHTSGYVTHFNLVQDGIHSFWAVKREV